MVIEGDWNLGAKHTMQYTDDIENLHLKLNVMNQCYSNKFNVKK